MLVRALRLPVRVRGFRPFCTAVPAAICVLVGCSRGDVSVAESADRRSATVAMNDLLAIRVPVKGGVARVHLYQRPDSVIWTSASSAPAVARVLGFDAEGGSLAYVDAKGAIVRVDLRSGRVASVTKPSLKGLMSSDGSAVYGVAADGMIHRVTPTARWTYRNARGVQELFPQPDGSLIISTDRGDSTYLFRMRPPETSLLDTVAIPRSLHSVTTEVGDRMYFATSEGLMAVRSRDLTPTLPIDLDRRARAIAPTPSGDRIYVLTDSTDVLHVVDRYREKVERTIQLPGVGLDLRMDPLGRYVLVRAATADSAWVIAVGTDKVIGTLPSVWRADLPAIAADGSLLTIRDDDVVAVDPETRRGIRKVAGGAKDFWHIFTWTGFRPRSAGLDVPVTFASRDSLGEDSTFIRSEPGLDTGDVVPPAGGSTTDRVAAIDSAFQRPSYTVSFATLMQEQTARTLASTITIRGLRARVVSADREGTPIFRVVLGPYTSRELADRAGRESGKPFWVFEGNP